MKAWAVLCALLGTLALPISGCGSASVEDCLAGNSEACYVACRDGHEQACQVRDGMLAERCRASDLKACRFLCESQTRLHWSCYEAEKIQTAQR